MSLVDKLDNFFDPFDQGPARHLKSGTEIDKDIIQGLLGSTKTGEMLLEGFIETRVRRTGENRVHFAAPIRNPKIKTGLEKTKKEPKIVNILREDKQAFGALVGKSTSAEEAHSYPLTSIPLALASPERNLRQGTKADLRNLLINDSNALKKEVPLRADWIVDGMSAVRSIKVKPTWGLFAEAFLEFCTPGRYINPHKLIIVMDTYGENRIKEMIQLMRGKPGRRVHINSHHQAMPNQADWAAFLNNGENKTELIKFLLAYYKKEEVRTKLNMPLIITEGGGGTHGKYCQTLFKNWRIAIITKQLLWLFCMHPSLTSQ